MNLRQIAPERDERLLVVGQTGTGKSTLCEKLLPLYPWLLINDPRGDFGGPEGWRGAEIVTDLRQLPRSRARVIQVRLPMQQQDEEHWHTLYQWAFENTQRMIYTDELAMVMDAYQVPDGFRACACQGRARGIGMINACQRPASIPVVARSEAQRYIVFELALRDDRKSVAEFMGHEGKVVIEQPARDHNFYAYSKHERQLRYLTLPIDTQGGG